jgi:hypothetical protein
MELEIALHHDNYGVAWRRGTLSLASVVL